MIIFIGKTYEFPEESKTRGEVTVKFPAYSVKVVRDPLKAKSEEWRDTAHKILFTIGGKEFDFYTGNGHRTWSRGKNSWLRDQLTRKEWERLKYKNLTEFGFQKYLENSDPKLPDIEELFFSLTIDASAAEMTFTDWCSEYGYDTDSRSALKTYEDCQNAWVKAREVIKTPLETLQKYYEDY